MRDAAMVLALALAGCGAAVRPARPTPVEETVAVRLEDIAYRGGAPATVAGLRLTRLDSGAVRVVRASAASGDDLRIEAAVRGAVLTDPLLSGVDLDVDVDRGVVRLSGDLASPEQAARALAIALDTPGVVAAETRCAWLSRDR